ncbi:MAG: YitT family protein [Mucinivorans sp.]
MKSSIAKTLREYVIISLGLLVYCFAFTTILVPAEIVPGGAGGLATLLYYAFEGHFTVGFYYFIVNAILLTFGVLAIGPRFGIKTIYAIIFNTAALSLMQLYIPSDLLDMDPNSDKLLMSILGGVLAGVGIGTCFSQGGSSGGTDIIALVINKYRNISVGKVIIACDVIIVCSSYFLKGEVRPIVYGFVVMGVMGYTIDMVLSGSKQSAQVMIFSPHNKQIAAAIINQVGRGVSFLDGEGGFTGAPQKIVLVVCRKTEQSAVYRVVKSIDPNAFITVGSVMGVYGKGFEALKVKEPLKIKLPTSPKDKA